MKLTFRSAALGMLGLLAGWQAVSAATVNVPAAADNTLYEDQAGGLSNGAGNHLFVGTTAGITGGLVRRGVVRFDVASVLPAGATVDSVVMSLTMNRTISGAQDIGEHRLDRAWGEGSSDASGQEGGGAQSAAGDATWVDAVRGSDLWNTPGGDFAIGASATTAVSGAAEYSWTGAALAADVQDMLENPAGNHGWILVGNESTIGTAKRFWSREGGANGPILTIGYTPIPEPGVVALLTLGAVATLSRRRG